MLLVFKREILKGFAWFTGFRESGPGERGKSKSNLSKKGQVLLEGLFFMICLLSFLLAIQFFQSLAREKIQEERLAKQNSQKIKKSRASSFDWK